MGLQKFIGRAPAKPNIYRGLAKLATGGGLTQAQGRLRALPGMKVRTVEASDVPFSIRRWVRAELDTRLVLTVGLCVVAWYFTLNNGFPRAPFLYFLIPPILICWWFGPVYGGIAVALGFVGAGMYGLQHEIPAKRFAYSAFRYTLICAVPMTIAYRMQRHVRKREALMAQLVAVDQRRDEFFANLSHEMRTPLNAIRGYCQMLTKYGTRDPALVEKSTDVITRSVQHLDRLVEDMLDVSVLVRGQMRLQPEIVEPVPLILDALEVVRFGVEAKQIRLVHHLAANPPRIRVDPMRCQQILWNLLSNAMKFTPPGGRIDVSLWRERQVVVIAVKDTGIGMERAFVARVFDRFAQADASATRTTRGLGLGLSIAKNLVDLMGGTLDATSPGPGLGSTFTMRLPIAE